MEGGGGNINKARLASPGLLLNARFPLTLTLILGSRTLISEALRDEETEAERG